MIQSRTPLTALLGLALLLTLTACGTQTVNTVEDGEPVATPQMVIDKRIATDDTLERKARIVGVNESTTGNGFRKVQVQVHNATHERQEFNYQFEWFDPDGMRIRDLRSNWVRASLAGKESTYLQSVAPSPKAVDFRLKLVEPGS